MKITHRVKNAKHYLEKTVVVRLQHKMVQHIINASMMTGLEYNTIATLTQPLIYLHYHKYPPPHPVLWSRDQGIETQVHFSKVLNY